MVDIGLVVKATRRCNLRCSYCHDWRHGREFDMSFETVARMTATILQDPEVRRVHFTWHGGEPTLLPLDFYRRALLVQSRFKRDDQEIRNGVQTNATLLGDEWCQFMVENRFRAGVSIDGPRTLQDVQRPFVSGRGTSGEVGRGVNLLKEWGIEFGVLMVIDRPTLELGPRALFEFIVALDVPRVGLISAKPNNAAAMPERPSGARLSSPEHYTNEREMGGFLLGLYDEWESHGNRNIRIRELDALCRRIRKEEVGVCTLAGACVGKHFLIETNGDVAHCDLFLGDPEYTAGSVYEHSFSDLRRAQPLVRLQTAYDREQAAMSECPYYSTCNGGCPHDRYLSVRFDRQHRTNCCGLRELIAALSERMARAKAATSSSSIVADRVEPHTEGLHGASLSSARN